ncbi:MAG: OmpA family protein [Rhodospirillaceae bacterium]
MLGHSALSEPQGNRDCHAPLRTRLLGGLAGLALFSLAACSADTPAAERAANAPGDFPDVNEVTEDRPASPEPAQLESVAQGLVADRARARYVQDSTRRAASEVAGPGPAASTTIAAAPPAPTNATIASLENPAAPPVATAAAGVAPAEGGTGVAAVAPPPMQAPVAPPVAFPTAPPVATPAPVPVPFPTGPAIATTGPGGTVVVDGRGVVQTAALPGAGAAAGSVAGFASGAGAGAGYGAAGPLPLASYDPRGVAVSSKVGVIYFANSSSSLDQNDVSVIREIAAYQRTYGGTLRVIGHASSRTGDMDPARHKAVNLEMSGLRANAVARALMAAGVPPASIYVGAVGDEQKVYREVMPSGEAHNRRTEVFLDY